MRYLGRCAYPVAVHQVIRRAPAAWPLRLLLVTLLLAGLALAGDRHCADDVLIGPTPIAAAHDHPPGAHNDTHGHTTPGELFGLCVTVLAAVGGAMLLLAEPGRWRAMLPILRALPEAVASLLPRPPALSQLGICRT
ncbi:hypothetical protein AB0H43_26635 [Hamadaea sp. NPDC050747]|uniref:hypothetical protein n=1 Tax=Hamadaea sp. NPDC050747 TaxID=3155789 RepID=UPI0033EA3F27